MRPLDLADHPRRAVDCAIAIRDFGERFRNDTQAAAAGFGRTRIGLETGIVVVGDVGGGRKLDYTAHGEAMNMAARFEAANKELGSSICIGPATAARLPNRALRPLGRLDVRGRSTPAEVFDPWPEALDKSDRKTYLKAVALAERDPLAAAKQLDQLASLTPHDPVPARLAARLRGGAADGGIAGSRSRKTAVAAAAGASRLEEKAPLIKTTLANAALMRGGFQTAGSVGGSPGLAMLVPNPLPSVTVLPAAVTSTVPRATKTPKTPLLGPAKTRVPRMAISPNRLRSTLSALCCLAGPIVEQAAFHEAEFSAGVGDVAIDRQARGRPEPEPGVAAEAQREPGGLARHDRLLDEHVGAHGQRAARALELGESLATNGLDEARSRRRLRAGDPKRRSQTGANSEEIATVDGSAPGRARLCSRHRSHPPY